MKLEIIQAEFGFRASCVEVEREFQFHISDNGTPEIMLEEFRANGRKVPDPRV